MANLFLYRFVSVLGVFVVSIGVSLLGCGAGNVKSQERVSNIGESRRMGDFDNETVYNETGNSRPLKAFIPTRIFSTFTYNEIIDKSATLCVKKVGTSTAEESWCIKLLDAATNAKPIYPNPCGNDTNCLPAARSDSYRGTPIAKRENSEWFKGYGKYKYTVMGSGVDKQVETFIEIDGETEEVQIQTTFTRKKESERPEYYIDTLLVAAIRRSDKTVKLHRLWDSNEDIDDSDGRFKYEIVNDSDRSIYGVGAFSQFHIELQEKKGSGWYVAEYEALDCDAWGSRLHSGDRTIAEDCFLTPGKEVLLKSAYNCFRVIMDYSHKEEKQEKNEKVGVGAGVQRYRLVDMIEKVQGACETVPY